MVIAIDGLGEVRAKNKDKKIILTSGTFDLFHVGHLRYLEAVKTYGDVVVVMLSGDARIKARKGPSRPIINEGDRAQILDALKMVDYVFIDPVEPKENVIDPIFADIIEKLQPDLYVTDGLDVRFSDILDKSKIVILPRAEGGEHASTTAIIELIKNQN